MTHKIYWSCFLMTSKRNSIQKQICKRRTLYIKQSSPAKKCIEIFLNQLMYVYIYKYISFRSNQRRSYKNWMYLNAQLNTHIWMKKELSNIRETFLQFLSAYLMRKIIAALNKNNCNLIFFLQFTLKFIIKD